MRGTQRSLLHVRLMGSWVRTWSFTQWRRALRRIRVAGNVGVVSEVCGDGLGAHFVPVSLRELALPDAVDFLLGHEAVGLVGEQLEVPPRAVEGPGLGGVDAVLLDVRVLRPLRVLGRGGEAELLGLALAAGPGVTLGLAHLLVVLMRARVPGGPAHNGLAERTHRSTRETARALLIAADLDAKRFWVPAYEYAAFLNNIAPTSALPDGMSPYRAWYGHDPRVNSLRTFGCKVFFYAPGGKFGKQAQTGIYLGPDFATTGGAARIYNTATKRTVITRDFRVDETAYARVRPPTAPAPAADPLPSNTVEEDEATSPPSARATRMAPAPTLIPRTRASTTATASLQPLPVRRL